jgi:hypothetical protein
MSTKPLMTLTELADAAAAATTEVGQASGRVREQPDVRTIRYYTTLGLIDRAAEMRGRTAFYGEKHLRQLVAIKRMQAEGLSLQDVQARMLGLSAQALRSLAPLPERLPSTERPAMPDEAPKARAGFWKDRPTKAAKPPPPKVHTMQTLELAPGVLLTFDSEAPVSAEKLQAILEAARPLVRVLEPNRRSEQ